jgi:hypothetical protein
VKAQRVESNNGFRSQVSGVRNEAAELGLGYSIKGVGFMEEDKNFIQRDEVKKQKPDN